HGSITSARLPGNAVSSRRAWPSSVPSALRHSTRLPEHSWAMPDVQAPQLPSVEKAIPAGARP
ncbi:hypothetical protein, partial [Pseudomonas cyclaminis]|uniref:hypothetical protein n=1 Tax=Pseudomonas cyclaminis TaxID=2781239 RepID=UPI0019D652F2